jgi:hypothetical protein
MAAVCCCETLTAICQTARRRNPVAKIFSMALFYARLFYKVFVKRPLPIYTT